MKFDFRNFLLAIVFSLVTVTIISVLLSQYVDFQTIKTGKAFLIVFIGTFLTILFLSAYDKKFEKTEIVTLIFVALALAGAFYALYKFVPEIFSALPQSTKDLFSAIGV